MKTFRKSASTEARNAREAIASRGGASGLSRTVSQSQQVLSGRRLRRAARSGARLEMFEVPDEGALFRPTIAVALDPYSLAILGWQIRGSVRNGSFR